MAKILSIPLASILIFTSCGTQSYSPTQATNMKIAYAEKQASSPAQVDLARNLLSEKIKSQSVSLKHDLEKKVNWAKAVTFTSGGAKILSAPLDDSKFIVIGLDKNELGFKVLALGNLINEKAGGYTLKTSFRGIQKASYELRQSERREDEVRLKI